MQADSMLPAAERRGYKHVGDALGSIVKNEGVGGIFKGAMPTCVRAMALNFGMYDFLFFHSNQTTKSNAKH